jgi:peptide chain release factor 2
MHDTKRRIHDLNERLDNFLQSFDLADKKKQIEILTAESLNPHLWDDQENARKTMQKLDEFTAETSEIEKMAGEIRALMEFASEGELTEDFSKDVQRLEKQIEKIELKIYLSGAYDKKNAILSIHAGQGGTEAMDWANMLFRMYFRYSERKGWKLDVVDETAGEEAGIKSITCKISGLYAYGYLKKESGTHRLVRQSPFNADKLRQTSFALVEVLPEFEDVDLPDIEIKDDDIEIQFFRASSQGGQNVQKVSTAVRIKHKPSGIVVTAQTERYQEQNRKNAMSLLKAKLWALEQEKRSQEKDDIRGEYTPATWGTQIRSYVLHPYKMIKDLRTEVETGNTDSVLDGDLDEFIDAELKLA